MIDWQNGARIRFSADGKSLEGLCIGTAPADAPTIIMLHEGLGCIDMWKDFPQEIADETGYGVFVYSRAGYGQSDPADLPRPVDYMTREAINVLPQVLDAVRLQRGILLGHSDGASIAAIYSGSVSDMRIRGLILMAPHFFTEPDGLASIRRMKDAYDQGDLREKLAKYHKDPGNAFRGWNDVWLKPEFAGWNIGDSIDHLRIPVLAFQGSDDEYGTRVQLDEVDERTYSPAETTILEDCGHSPHRDQPEKALALIADFAARLQRLEMEKVTVA
ncbi:MAG: alpha/beta fold hydrolase [Rhizobiaceae bacterium]